jgi:hypothetical protein
MRRQTCDQCATQAEAYQILFCDHVPAGSVAEDRHGVRWRLRRDGAEVSIERADDERSDDLANLAMSMVTGVGKAFADGTGREIRLDHKEDRMTEQMVGAARLRARLATQWCKSDEEKKDALARLDAADAHRAYMDTLRERLARGEIGATRSDSAGSQSAQMSAAARNSDRALNAWRQDTAPAVEDKRDVVAEAAARRSAEVANRWRS